MLVNFTVIIIGNTPLKCVSCVSLQLEVYMLILYRSLASINKKIYLTMHLMTCINVSGNYSKQKVYVMLANKSGTSYSIYKYGFTQ